MTNPVSALEPFQSRSIIDATAITAVDIVIDNLPALDFCIGFQGSYLGID